MLLKAHLFTLLVIVSIANAEESVIKAKVAVGAKNKVEGDIDQEIINRKLRTDSGSKSKFSGSMHGGYTGGTFSNAFGTYRPALSKEPGTQVFTSFDVGLLARYRPNKNNSFTLGTMFGFVTPIQGRVTGNDAINVNDPMLGFNHVEKVGGLQIVSSTIYMYGTSISSLEVDLEHTLMTSLNTVKTFQNGISVGVGVSGSYYLYGSKPGENSAKPGYYGGDRRTQWSLSLFPTAEYSISDKLSVRTVFGYGNWKHLYGDPNRGRMLKTYVYQSVGVGISVARDFYLYPNIQFVPDNIRSDFTNVALSGMINIF